MVERLSLSCSPARTWTRARCVHMTRVRNALLKQASQLDRVFVLPPLGARVHVCCGLTAGGKLNLCLLKGIPLAYTGNHAPVALVGICGIQTSAPG